MPESDSGAGEPPATTGIKQPCGDEPIAFGGRGQSIDQLRFLTRQLTGSLARARFERETTLRKPTAQSANLLKEIERQMPLAIDTIRSALWDMTSLANGMRTLNILDAREMKFESVDVDAMVQELVRSRNLFTQTHNINVTIEPLDPVIADKQSLLDIFQGLFDNALKYLAPDRPGDINIRSHRELNYTTFCIQDNGRGIADHEYDRVFDVFQRSEEVVHISGEGMGIPYVQILVRHHGGSLWFVSEHGVGSTFYFTLDNHLE